MWEPSITQEEHKRSTPLPHPAFPTFSIQQLMESGTRLLASSGKEFTKPNGIFASAAEVQKARKAAMGRLGLEFLDDVGGADDMDWEKELASADAEATTDIKVEDAPKQENGHSKVELPIEGPYTHKTESSPDSRPKSATPPAPEDNLTGLSARERNRLKRKRKPGNSAFVAAPPPPQNLGAKYTATPAGPSNSKYVFPVLSPLRIS